MWLKKSITISSKLSQYLDTDPNSTLDQVYEASWYTLIHQKIFNEISFLKTIKSLSQRQINKTNIYTRNSSQGVYACMQDDNSGCGQLFNLSFLFKS